MTTPGFDAIAAAVHLLPALVWGIVAYHAWRLGRDFHLRLSSLRIAPIVAAAMAVHFVLHAVIALTPTELDGRATGLHAVLESFIAVAVAVAIVLFRHMVPTLAVPEEPRRPGWLALNYGSALVVSLFAFLPLVVPRWPESLWFGPQVLPVVYAMVMVVLALRHARRLARRGVWRAGLAVAELRSPDVVVVGAGVFFTGAMLLMSVATNGTAPSSAAGLFLHTAMGVGIAIPFVVRMFGRVVRTFLMSIAMFVAAAAVYIAARALRGWAPGAEIDRLIDLGAIAVLVMVLIAARAWLAGMIDRLVLRRGQGRQAELQAFLYALSPELGVTECCRRVLAEACRIMHLRGAAILLREGGTIAHGAFDPGPLERAWPRGAAADALPDRTFSESDLLRELPPTLREALLESAVVWVAPISSPRRRWGHLFGTEGLLTMASSTEDARDFTGFVGQLALLFDTAELLARAVAVERSLAHAEKLAAIGETAARIAHEIRNPVTAARSLAQQLGRDPTSPLNTESARLILAELERVERQVAALLRFARREEFRFETIDLGELVRATVDQFRPRLEAAAVDVRLELPAGITPLADREKLRQVLVNLLENALDALASAPRRELALAVRTVDGSATLSVRDSGPGVPADALPRLFEPFFTLKTGGTGLGLAIARRMIDAHGGRISARPGDGGGLRIELALPLVPTGQGSPSRGTSGAAEGRTS